MESEVAVFSLCRSWELVSAQTSSSSAMSRIHTLKVEMKMQSAPRTTRVVTPMRRRRLPFSGFAGALVLSLTQVTFAQARPGSLTRAAGSPG